MSTLFHTSMLLLGASCSGKTSWLTAAVALMDLLSCSRNLGATTNRVRYGLRFAHEAAQAEALRTYQRMFAQPDGGEGWPEPTPGIEPLDLVFRFDSHDALGIRAIDMGGHLLSADPGSDEGARELYDHLCCQPSCVVIVVPLAVFASKSLTRLLLDLKGQLCWIGKLLERASSEGRLRRTTFVLLLTKSDECPSLKPDLIANDQILLRQRFEVLPTLFSGDALTLVHPMSLVDRADDGDPCLDPRDPDWPFVFAVLAGLRNLRNAVLPELSTALNRLRAHSLEQSNRLRDMSISGLIRRRFSSSVRREFDQMKASGATALEEAAGLIRLFPQGTPDAQKQALRTYCEEQAQQLRAREISCVIRRLNSERVQGDYNDAKAQGVQALNELARRAQLMVEAPVPPVFGEMECVMRQRLLNAETLYKGGLPISISEI